MSRRPLPFVRHIVALAIVLGAATPAYAADLLDTVIQYAAPEVAPAKPLIECLAGGGDAVACAKEVAATQAKGALPFQPTDPSVQKIVKAFEAARDEKWLVFLGIVGEVAAGKITCAIIPLPGTLKAPACSIIGYVIEENGKLLADTYQALKGPDWWALVKIAGTGICKFIPVDGPAGYAKDILCGALGQILVAAQQVAELLGGGMVAVSDALEKAIFGDDSHMPKDKYYALYWQPWYHYAVDRRLQELNYDWPVKSIKNRCVEYFDSHDEYKSTAEKTCKTMQTAFMKEVTGFVNAMPVAVNGYFESVARPAIKTAVLVSYGKPFTGTPPGQKFFLQNCAFQMGARFPFPPPNELRCQLLAKRAQTFPLFKTLFLKLAQQCNTDTKSQLPSPTAWVRACEPMGPEYGKAFAQEAMHLIGSLGRLKGKGCTFASKADAAKIGLSITCPTYASYSACLTELAPNDGRKYCHAKIVAKISDQPVGGVKVAAKEPTFSGLINVEAEDLIATNKVTAQGGQISAQDTAGFGSGWSGNKQLFWTASAGNSLELTIDVPTSGSYAVELYLARAPDYGNVKIAIDGKPSATTFLGYSPRVMAPTPLQVGKFSLTQGEHKLRLEVADGYRDAKGTYVGVDRVRLYWAGNP